jgi:hypothetical protein
MLEVRSYNPTDYNMLSVWWNAHKWPPMPEQFLPPTGRVVEINGKPVCAGFLYKTDSAFAWLEWLVSDPSSGKMERSQALDSLIAALISDAQALGFQAIHTSARHPGLIDRYQAHGFVLADSQMTNLTWVRK